MKKCCKCQVDKQDNEFYLRKGKPQGYCKTCTKKASATSRTKLGRRHRKNLELQWHYGITIEQFEDLLKECEGKCVCGKTRGRANKAALHVDHNHDTGQIRGLLCHSCNRTIGLTNNPELLRKLADYLESANSRGFKGNGGRASGC
mgnify:CR=1 FL=1